MIASLNFNYAAIIVGGLAYWGIGWVWYSKWFFGQEMANVEARGNSAKDIIFRAVNALILSAAMAVLVAHTGSSSQKSGLILGLVVGIGFVTTTSIINNRAQNQTAILLINSGYHITGCVIIAVLESLWRSV